jgi:hypothetical protein
MKPPGYVRQYVSDTHNMKISTSEIISTDYIGSSEHCKLAETWK